MTATIGEIRNLMDSVSASQLADDVLTAHLTRAINWVGNTSESTATAIDVDNAVRALAVWLAYGSYTEGMSRQLGSVPETARWKLEHYRRVAELFVNDVSKSAIDFDEDRKTPIGLPPLVEFPTSEGWQKSCDCDCD